MPKITMRIRKDGSSETKVEGVSGPECTKLTAGVTRAFGVETYDIDTEEMEGTCDLNYTRNRETQ